MATWGEFINEIKVQRMQGQMYVHCNDVIDLFDSRNKWRDDARRFEGQLALEREASARDIDEFASACEEEGKADYAAVLRAAADLVRQRGQPQAEVVEGEEVIEAQPVSEEPPPLG